MELHVARGAGLAPCGGRARTRSRQPPERGPERDAPLLLPGLLDAARHNVAHGVTGLALFESGHTYRPADGLGAPEGSPRGAVPATERHHIGALLTYRAAATWRSPSAPADFYAAKGLVEALAAVARLDLEVAPGTRPFLHPGRSATVAVNGREMGWIGELHPLVARAWDLDGAAAFELDAGALAEEAQEVVDFQDVTSFPAALQDIAVVAPMDVSAAEVRAAVREGGGELLASTEVFDVYTGEQAGEGNRSLALRLRFQAPDRTLTDTEVAELRTAIETALERIGGRLRG